MLQIMARTALALSVVMALTSSGEPSETSIPASGGDTSGKAIAIEGSSALQWGDGAYGVVLAHGAAFDAASWEKQAVAIAHQGATVIAVENIDPDAIRDAVEKLQGEGVADVALIGASAGADAILDLSSRDRRLADQLILLSPNATVDGLGDQPKLFVASKDEPLAHVSTELAESAPGDDNVVKILAGSAHAQNIFATNLAGPVLDAMLERLKRFAPR
ncbi:alpha/beta hydrolase [Phycicoccus sp. Root101]|uniref:alpha/beta hydrolase n=1 Tax=Phycicoccus sp. Root101 TaxID=1736421 RepID=UPI000A532A17|nr:alpha/beta hydrolase [Phycicoccus sp. Root101]